MNDIKKLLSEKIVEPAANSRSSSVITGVILKSNEMSNTCKVKIYTSNGKTETRSDVPVFIYNKSIIDWFPKKGDKILLQEKNTVLYIIGPSDSNYDRLRTQVSLKNDVFSDSFLDCIGGFIF